MNFIKEKNVIKILVVLILFLTAGFIYSQFINQDDDLTERNSVYVEQVDEIISSSSNSGRIDKYSGVVETQKQTDISAAADRQIKEILVTEGQSVARGDILFKYDIEQDNDKINKIQIEMDRITNTIKNKKEEIKKLERIKNSIGKDEEFDYMIQIQTAQNELKQSEYEYKEKTIEIEKLKNTVNNAEVTSEIDGVIKLINKDNSDGSEPLISILSTGKYRIKGKINEQNISNLSEGQRVIVHSRVDEEKIWLGKIDKIDTQKPIEKKNEESGEGTDAQSSSYFFYVDLDSSSDLMLGQHVYIEPDLGQQDKTENIWLDESYLIVSKSKAYVWIEGTQKKLEKKEIKLGKYNEQTAQYEILRGISKKDKIAFPDKNLKEGLKTIDSTLEENYDIGIK